MSAELDLHDIEQVMQGNTSSYASLVERHKDMVYTIAKRIVKSAEDAEEVAQDTFMKAFKEIHTFQGGSKFSTWLYSIVYRTAISKTRKKQLEVSQIDEQIVENYAEDFSVPQIEELTRSERVLYTHKAIDRPPEMEATIITLYYLQDLSVDEIHEVVGISQSNIKVKLFRARKQLYKELEGMLKHELTTIL